MLYAGRMVMVGDCLDRKVRESPQTKQIGADFCMRDSKEFLFHFESLATTLCSKRENRAELSRHLTRQDEPADIVKEGSQDN